MLNPNDRQNCPNPKCDGELEFIDRWDTTHDKCKCVKCGKFYHLISQEDYDLWMDKIQEAYGCLPHNESIPQVNKKLQDKLLTTEQRLLTALRQRKKAKEEVEELKHYKTAWENWFSIIDAGATTVNECIEIAHKVLPDNFNR